MCFAPPSCVPGSREVRAQQQGGDLRGGNTVCRRHGRLKPNQRLWSQGARVLAHVAHVPCNTCAAHAWPPRPPADAGLPRGALLGDHHADDRGLRRLLAQLVAHAGCGAWCPCHGVALVGGLLWWGAAFVQPAAHARHPCFSFDWAVGGLAPAACAHPSPGRHPVECSMLTSPPCGARLPGHAHAACCLHGAAAHDGARRRRTQHGDQVPAWQVRRATREAAERSMKPS